MLADTATTGSDPLERARAAQHRAAAPRTSVWVSANAGTGKTKVLTDRVLNLLLDGTAPERILCLTFTKAAAAEMATRLAQKLSGWAVQSDEALDAELIALGSRPDASLRLVARRLFARLLDVPGGMRIETIHAFCQALLRRFPLEAGVSPQFALLDDRDAAEMMAEAQEHLLYRARREAVGDDGQAQDALGAPLAPPPATGSGLTLTEALALLTQAVHETRFPDLLRAVTSQRARIGLLLQRHRQKRADGTGEDGLAGTCAALRQRLGIAADETPARLLQDAVAATDQDWGRHLAKALTAGGKTDQRFSGDLLAWLASTDAEKAARWEVYTGIFLTKEGEPRQKFPSKAVVTAFPDLVQAIDREALRLQRVADRFRAVTVAHASEALLTVAAALIDDYQQRKDRLGVLDFDDLIHAARRLLDDSEAAAWVLFKLDGGIDHVMVDEAQDTNADQWSVIRGLTSDFFVGLSARDVTDPGHEKGRTIFAVGDRKQSIYSFQGADPDIFDQMHENYQRVVPQAGRDFATVSLDVSFRSTPAVLKLVDAVFTQDNGQDGPQEGVVASGEEVTHYPRRAQDPGRVELWPPMPATDLETPEQWKPPVEAIRGEAAPTRLARLLARRLKQQIGHDWLPSRQRFVQAGDILVLVRRRTGFVDDLVRALKQENVPVAGVDRMVLIEQLAVMDLLALGEALLLPEDDLTLACVLKSPLIGLSEEQLFTVAANRPAGVTLWQALRQSAEREHDQSFEPTALRPPPEAPYRFAYRLLRELMQRADFLPPHELYAHLLGTLHGRKKLLSRLGPDAADPIDEFVQLTLSYDRGHPPSLQAFLHWVRSGDVEIKRDMEEASNAVRVMTVHGSKGLQAPIVVLPDTLQRPKASSTLLWDEDAELVFWVPRSDDRDTLCRTLADDVQAQQTREYNRLLYVALTRAEDQLLVCGWQTSRAAGACWYEAVKNALETLAEDPDLLADQGFSLSYDDDAFLQKEGPAFGLEQAAVWRLENGQPSASLPPTAPEAPPSPPSAQTAQTAPARLPQALPAWSHRLPPSDPALAHPLTPSQLETADPPARSPLESDEDIPRLSRGTLLHRLLQSLPEVPDHARAGAAERYLARPVWELSERQQQRLVREVLAVLSHPDFAPLFGPGSQAEVPLTGIVGRHVVSGKVDRLLVTADEVLVVDYKTNRPPPTVVEDVAPAYLQQVALYQAVLRQIFPHHRLRCALLWTDTATLMELPPPVLEQALKEVVGELPA